MKRTPIYLDPEQDKWLRDQAFQRNTTKSALVRLAVDLLQARVTTGMALDSEPTQREGTGP